MKEILIFILLAFVLVSASFFLIPKALTSDPAPNNSAEAVKPVSIRQASVFLPDLTSVRNDLISKKTAFLEVNIEKMKVVFYKDGVLQEEIPIAANGDPQEWAGTPNGLYSVLSGHEVAYSIAAEVNMPWAVNFYGLFWLHGMPFYPGGEERFRESTGGCVQFSNENAKKIYNLVQIGTPVLVIDRENDGYKYESRGKAQPNISAKSFLAADLDSGYVFAEKQSKEQLPIASLTKLMTALIPLENNSRKSSILVTNSMLTALGTTTGLTAGKSFRMIELFYPLFIESSNDAAEVLSRFQGRSRTIDLMNEKAGMIMMQDTKYFDPSGLDHNNVSTPQDLFYLARYIANNHPLIFKITKGENVRTFGEVAFRNLDNKNIFFDDPNFIGGKTGYNKAADYTGVFLFNVPAKDGSERRIAIIVLGLKTEKIFKDDTVKLLDWVKENYF